MKPAQDSKDVNLFFFFNLVKKVNLSFSQRLQQARQQKGWTQKELAVVSSLI